MSCAFMYTIDRENTPSREQSKMTVWNIHDGGFGLDEEGEFNLKFWPETTQNTLYIAFLCHFPTKNLGLSTGGKYG